jgi:hypothetical protein
LKTQAGNQCRPQDEFIPEVLKRKTNQIPLNSMKTNLLVAILVALVSIQALAQTNKPNASNPTNSLNEKVITAAWEALAGGKNETAITNANQYIAGFHAQAAQLQEKLQKEKADFPTGAVSDDVKKKILENGVLNNVAAGYFIKGEAANNLGRTEDARRAYAEAKKLTYARVWDPQGWFWSPADAAGDKLGALKPH